MTLRAALQLYLPGLSLIALAGSLLVNLLRLSEQSAQPDPPPKKDVVSFSHPRDHTFMTLSKWRAGLGDLGEITHN